jgi:hypothetical protein
MGGSDGSTIAIVEVVNSAFPIIVTLKVYDIYCSGKMSKIQMYKRCPEEW